MPMSDWRDLKDDIVGQHLRLGRPSVFNLQGMDVRDQRQRV